MKRLLAALAGATRVADIGCGSGGLAAALVRRGYDVTGVDPQADLIEAARMRVPRACFHTASAETLPLADASMDAAVFLNALHHVPGGAMDAALAEALRILAPGKRLIVIEPLAQGDFFRAMQPIDDETVIRAKAIAALERLIAGDTCHLDHTERYDLVTAFAGLDAFLDYLRAAEPARAPQIADRAEDVARAFAAHARPEGSGFVLTQPLQIWVFHKP